MIDLELMIVGDSFEVLDGEMVLLGRIERVTDFNDELTFEIFDGRHLVGIVACYNHMKGRAHSWDREGDVTMFPADMSGYEQARCLLEAFRERRS